MVTDGEAPFRARIQRQGVSWVVAVATETSRSSAKGLLTMGPICAILEWRWPSVLRTGQAASLIWVLAIATRARARGTGDRDGPVEEGKGRPGAANGTPRRPLGPRLFDYRPSILATM